MKTKIEVIVHYEFDPKETGTNLKKEREVWRDQMSSMIPRPEFKVTRFSVKVSK